MAAFGGLYIVGGVRYLYYLGLYYVSFSACISHCAV